MIAGRFRFNFNIPAARRKFSMKLFTAGLATETNTFSPLPTGYRQFSEAMMYRGGIPDKPGMFAVPLVVFRNLAARRGWQVVESLCTYATPGGKTTRAAYEGFRRDILDDLRAAMPVDAVLLSLHGAMVAEGYDDCEGDLLQAIRDAVGADVPIGAELDAHAHLTQRMLDHATAFVIFKEYPHTDYRERAEDLFRIIADTLDGKVAPHMSVFDCRMITFFHTTVEPMRGFVAQMKELEGEPDVLSVSVAHAFPWGDVADNTAKMLVVTNGQPTHGQALAKELGQQLISLRGKTHPRYLGLEESLDTALASEGQPVVIADVSDNAGCGAASDSMFFAHAMLERGIADAAIGIIWDPVAVSFAVSAGEGATLAMRIGGKTGPMSGSPLDGEFRIKRIVRNATQTFVGDSKPMGDAVVLHIRGIDLVVNDNRLQTFNPDAFSNLGIDPASKKILVVKSAQHFRAGFDPIASKIIYAAAPGAVKPDFANIPFQNIPEPRWPLQPDIFVD